MLAAQTIRHCLMLAACGLLVAGALLTSRSVGANGTAPPLLISQTPLTVTIPAHPQIVLALANSQSMDGSLSGAIMTGSGSLPAPLAADLAPSSSPSNYTIPVGFTPPLNLGAGGVAPYTATAVSGALVDNSPSRLNVAKAGISAILNTFIQYADFALMDYSTTNLGEYTTWVYYMSASGSGFTFTSSPPNGSDYVANPCYNANVALTDPYSEACAALQTNFGAASGVITQPYVIIGASSDDPLINDVFYAQSGYQPPVCVEGVPSAPNPYTAFGLADYESGGVAEFYGVLWGSLGYSWSCDPGMAPTNAGYVPYSPQVMQVARGFGYDATTVQATKGKLVVSMQSSGQSPTAASVATAIAAFTPYLQPETNNAASAELKAVAEQSPIAGIVEGAANYFSTSNPPSTNACAPARYIVLVTDGLPTKDLSGNAWPPLGTASAIGYGVSATFNADGSLNSTNDQALTDAISQITSAASQGVKTYVIGLGAGVDPANNPQAASSLTAMAVAGGTGNYFAARSPSDLTSDMQVILAQILAATRSNASATVNTTGLNSTSTVYQPSFTTSDINQDWTGDIKAYPISPTTGLVNFSSLDWSASAQLDLLTAGNGWSTSRIIATWDPVANAGTPFEWTAGTPATGIAASTVLGQELETNTADTNGSDALSYLRGDAALSIAGGGVYRNRTHILGDIVDSAPLYIGYAAGPYQSASYYAFESAQANRMPVLYVGANDGMLHAFNAATGQEMFAYIPNGVFANLIQLTNPYYNEQHLFFDDGSPQASDVQFTDGTWHTVLVSAERAGGNTVFALDVTNPASITSEAALATNVLWEFSDPNMGLSFSTPAIAQTAYGASAGQLGFTVFFGNGYNSASETPYLYALDPRTGTSLPGTPINFCTVVPQACNTANPNGLSSVVTVNGGDAGAPATTLYAGDLQGNVWRVDIHDPNPLNWVVTLLFQATDPSGNPQPITTTPAVSLNPDFPLLAGTMVYVGTGQMLGSPDLSTTQVQTMYAVYDSGSNAATLTRANLVQQVLSSSVVNGVTLRFVSGGQIALPSQNGWFVDLTLLSGERIVTDPRLVGGAVTVVTTQPSATVDAAMAIGPHPDSLGTEQPHANLLARTAVGPRASTPAGATPAASSIPDHMVYVGAPPMLSIPTSGYGSAARLWLTGTGVAPPPTLQSITVTPANPTINNGKTEQFTATGHYSDGSKKNLTSSVTWTSSTTSVATIGATGLASSVAAGATVITATDPSTGINGSTTLTVVTPPPPPPPPTLVSITVTPANPTIYLGNTQQFVATGTYSNGSTLNITATVVWSSSTTSVATISAGGLASSVAVGTTTITATDPSTGINGSTTLTVVTPPPPPPPPTLVSITVTPANPTIYVGNTQQFAAIATWSNGTTSNVTSLSTWTSGTTTVATINGSGLATSSTVGSTLITATYEGISGSTTLTVVNPPPPPTLVSIAVTPTNPSIYTGGTQQFVATGTYSNGSTQNLSSVVTWSSSATGVATINSSGLASGASAGSTTITATDGAISGNTTLTVVNPPPPPVLVSISVLPANPTINVGNSQGFTAIGTYNNGTTQNLTSSVTWSSSTTATATITAAGLATGVAAGTTTITATSGAVSGSTGLTVVTPPPPPPPPVCPGGDVSYLMEFNFAGGGFTTPVFNYNGAGTATASLVPANGMLLGNVYASAAVFNNYSGGTDGTGGAIGLITLSSGNIQSVYQIGLHRQRFAWWEIR